MMNPNNVHNNVHINILLDKNKIPDYDKVGELTTFGRVSNVLDELATLRAQNAELVTNIQSALYAIESNRGNLSKNARQSLDNLRALLAKHKESK